MKLTHQHLLWAAGGLGVLLVAYAVLHLVLGIDLGSWINENFPMAVILTAGVILVGNRSLYQERKKKEREEEARKKAEDEAQG